MKIISHFHGCKVNDKIVLKPADEKDWPIINKLFENKKNREDRTKQEVLLRCEIDAPYQHRTFKQNNAVWILVDIIFQSLEHRKGTKEELYDLYSSLLDEYADKKPNRLFDRLRPVHLSEMNTDQAGRFIDGLLFHLSTLCNLTTDLESDVRKFIYEWEEWKSRPENAFEEFRSMDELCKKVVYSEASGLGGVLHRHHIVSRGACPAAIEKTWNIMVLTPDEHNFFHQQCKTWNDFFEKYPHLKNKVELAYKKCNELVQEHNSIGFIDMADMNNAIEDMDDVSSMAEMALAAQKG